MSVSKVEISKSYKDTYFACCVRSVCQVSLKTGKIFSQFGLSAEESSNEDTNNTTEIETFSLCPSHSSLMCLGRNNGHIETWDISAKTLRNSAVLDGAVVKIVFSNSTQEPICLAATSSGSIHCFDALSGTVSRTFRGHKAPIFDLVLAKDDSFFITCSEDCTVKVFYLS